MEEMKCAKCGKAAKGWKCAICGEEAESHNENHTHGTPASARHCMPKCEECGQPEVHCTCEMS